MGAGLGVPAGPCRLAGGTQVPVYPWIILRALMVTSQWAFVLGLLAQGSGTKACFRGPKG